MSDHNATIDQVLLAWKPYVAAIDSWEALVAELEPKITGCGPVYELGQPLKERGSEDFAIADMRKVRVAEPHYHPNGETEIYIVLSGQGEVIIGGKRTSLQKGSIVVTPPDTTHYTLPADNLVLAVINTPTFNPANYLPIIETDLHVGFDKDQFKQLVQETYAKAGLALETGFDEPGKIYEPHRHEQTYLYTISGSLDIKLDNGEVQTLQPHHEFVVGGDQLHEAVVGPAGWEYIAAWDEKEAKQYEH